MRGLMPYEVRKNQLAGRRPRDIFDYFFTDDFFPTVQEGFSSFRADIKETDKKYSIEAEMPGLTKDDVQIELQDDILMIRAEKKEEKNEENGSYVRRERRYGSFSRSFRVENINTDDINAKFENGILKIDLPKLEKVQDQKQQIHIQ